jgi:hypothetical protein
VERDGHGHACEPEAGQTVRKRLRDDPGPAPKRAGEALLERAAEHDLLGATHEQPERERLERPVERGPHGDRYGEMRRIPMSDPRGAEEVLQPAALEAVIHHRVELLRDRCLA